jgi:hypothetical protein
MNCSQTGIGLADITYVAEDGIRLLSPGNGATEVPALAPR